MFTMSEKPTPAERIAGIRERLAAIAHVPTPWRQRVGDGLVIESAENGEVAECGFAHDAFSGEAIAELIAHAPADIAHLLAIIDAADALAKAGTSVEDSWLGRAVGHHPEGAMMTALARYRAARGGGA